MASPITMKDCKIELSLDNSVWTDISGYANAIEVSGGERGIAEAYAFNSDSVILVPGKRGAFEITVTVLYDEDTSNPGGTLRTAHANGTPVYLRWSPSGGQSGEKRFTTGAAYVTEPGYPGGEAESGDVVALEFTLSTAGITEETIV